MPITTSQGLDNGRDLRPDLARLFVGARHAKHDALSPLRPQDLESDGQSIRCPAGNADPGQTREVATKRQDIAQVPGARVQRLGSTPKDDSRRLRTAHHTNLR